MLRPACTSRKSRRLTRCAHRPLPGSLVGGVAFARPVWSRVKVTWPTQCGNSGGVSVLIAVCFTFCDKKVDQIRGSRKGTTAT